MNSFVTDIHPITNVHGNRAWLVSFGYWFERTPIATKEVSDLETAKFVAANAMINGFLV